MYTHLTVLEVLTLASHFYCANSIDDDEKAKLVNAVIMELGLVKAKDTLIGNDRVRGVSGGGAQAMQHRNSVAHGSGDSLSGRAYHWTGLFSGACSNAVH